jgi:cytochrome P450
VYLTRYADVFHVTRNDALFSSTRAATGTTNTAIVIPGGPVFENFQLPMEQDPPDQAEYRRLLDLLLSPAEVDALRPMIREHATRIVNEFIERGSADLVREMTNPLPTAVTLDWLGFPAADSVAGLDAIEQRSEIIGETGRLFHHERIHVDPLPVSEAEGADDGAIRANGNAHERFHSQLAEDRCGIFLAMSSVFFDQRLASVRHSAGERHVHGHFERVG